MQLEVPLVIAHEPPTGAVSPSVKLIFCACVTGLESVIWMRIVSPSVSWVMDLLLRLRMDMVAAGCWLGKTPAMKKRPKLITAPIIVRCIVPHCRQKIGCNDSIIANCKREVISSGLPDYARAGQRVVAGVLPAWSHFSPTAHAPSECNEYRALLPL